MNGDQQTPPSSFDPQHVANASNVILPGGRCPRLMENVVFDGFKAYTLFGIELVPLFPRAYDHLE